MTSAEDVATLARTMNWTNAQAVVFLRARIGERIAERRNVGQSTVLEEELRRQAGALADLTRRLERETRNSLDAKQRTLDQLGHGTGQLDVEVLPSMETGLRDRYDALLLAWVHFVDVFERVADLVQSPALSDDTQPNKVHDV